MFLGCSNKLFNKKIRNIWLILDFYLYVKKISWVRSPMKCWGNGFHTAAKVQWVILATLQVKSKSGSCNEIWILRPFSKAAEKTRSCFALHTEHQYWTVTVQCLCRVKKISMTSNFLPLHFAPSQASSSQSSNVDNF